MANNIEQSTNNIVEGLKQGVEKHNLNAILPHLNEDLRAHDAQSRIKILDSVNQELEQRGILPVLIAAYAEENMEALKTPLLFGLAKDRAIKKSDLDDRLASPALKNGDMSAAPLDRLIVKQIRMRFDEIRSSLDPGCRRDYFDGGQLCEKQPWGLDQEVFQAYKTKK